MTGARNAPFKPFCSSRFALCSSVVKLVGLQLFHCGISNPVCVNKSTMSRDQSWECDQEHKEAEKAAFDLKLSHSFSGKLQLFMAV